MRLVLGQFPCVTPGCGCSIELVVDDGYERTSTRSSLRKAMMTTADADGWRCAKCGWVAPLAKEMFDEFDRQVAAFECDEQQRRD